DILQNSMHGTGKTTLVFKSNMNFKRIEKYLVFLVTKGFLKYNHKEEYITTTNGKKLLNAIVELKNIIGR
ncbi:MAG: winged helix-turn-helix domain-containing protein, partial [Candidatus Methanofastidiosia archaeon]